MFNVSVAKDGTPKPENPTSDLEKWGAHKEGAISVRLFCSYSPLKPLCASPKLIRAPDDPQAALSRKCFLGLKMLIFPDYQNFLFRKTTKYRKYSVDNFV